MGDAELHSGRVQLDTAAVEENKESLLFLAKISSLVFTQKSLPSHRPSSCKVHDSAYRVLAPTIATFKPYCLSRLINGTVTTLHRIVMIPAIVS